MNKEITPAIFTRKKTMSDSPIGGDVKVIGVGESDYYDEDKGDFETRRFAKVTIDDETTPNDVGKVVDLLNEYDAETIRETILQRSGKSDD